LIYKGDWVNGKKHGHGCDYKITGEKIYEGAFVDKLREGLGVLFAENGTTVRYKG
jgi:antitoxin component YwqK of YwqJK toxin-antitoxin module